jgi:hypothetical protein
VSTETLPIAEASTPPLPAELLEIVASSGLTGDGVLTVQTAFCPFFLQVSEWQQKVATVTDPKVARESRLMLKKVRLEAEHKKDDLKSDLLKYTRAIDGAFRKVESTIKPMEAALEEVEKRAEREAAAKRTQLIADRVAKLKPYGVDPTFIALGDMPEESFAALLEQSRLAHETKAAAEAKVREEARIAAEKAEQERIAREKAEAEERERIRQENERLKHEAAEREKARIAAEIAARKEREAREAELAELKRKADAERAAAEAKARAEREAIEAEAKRQREEIERRAKAERETAEAKARAEREAREKAEAELRAAEQARIAKEKAEREAAERAAAAPDREKLQSFAAAVLALPVPAMATPRGRAAVSEIAAKVEDLARFIDQKARAL